MSWGYIIIGVLLLWGIAWFVIHQRSLRLRAELMQEAIRNHDFMFRLPTNGLLPGERAMQEALNHLGAVIRQQNNQNEVEAWEQLTRVLTHEIMNATAPIASISQAMLNRPDVKGTALEEGIHAIHSTSSHLNTFIDSYRKLSQLQQPDKKEVCISDVIKDIAQLYPALQWEYMMDERMRICTDPNMLRQTLINLTKNAIEAGAHRIGIELSSITQQPSPITLYVSNDGHPIAAENASSIFIPFFTTKRTGSGIGLSLSRRMMIQQGGGLELADRPRSGFHTTFMILFS